MNLKIESFVFATISLLRDFLFCQFIELQVPGENFLNFRYLSLTHTSGFRKGEIQSRRNFLRFDNL